MDRRSFLKSLAGTAVSTACIGNLAVAAESVVAVTVEPVCFQRLVNFREARYDLVRYMMDRATKEFMAKEDARCLQAWHEACS